MELFPGSSQILESKIGYSAGEHYNVLNIQKNKQLALIEFTIEVLKCIIKNIINQKILLVDLISTQV